jgi:hypothetical protein
LSRVAFIAAARRKGPRREERIPPPTVFLSTAKLFFTGKPPQKGKAAKRTPSTKGVSPRRLTLFAASALLYQVVEVFVHGGREKTALSKGFLEPL